MSFRRLWDRTPMEWKAAVVIGLVAQVCSLSSIQRASSNGMTTSCTYIDYLKIVAGLFTVFLLVVGWRKHSAPRAQLPGGVAMAVVGMCSVLAVLLLLRGFGLVLNPCDDLTAALR